MIKSTVKPARKKSERVSITVKEATAHAVGMNVEEAVIRVNVILQRHKILPACFSSVLFEDKKVLICTTRAIIECDRRMITSTVRTLSVGHTVGRNVTGHKLPACSPGRM